MIFGYIDESGAPGVASRKHDYLVASLVIFESEESRDKSITKINNLREKKQILVKKIYVSLCCVKYYFSSATFSCTGYSYLAGVCSSVSCPLNYSCSLCLLLKLNLFILRLAKDAIVDSPSSRSIKLRSDSNLI